MHKNTIPRITSHLCYILIDIINLNGLSSLSEDIFSSNTSTDTSLELIRVSGNVKRQFRTGFRKIKSTCSWKQLLKSLLLTRGGTLIEYFKYIGHSEDFWFIVNYPLMGVLYENWQDNVEFKLSSNTSTESIDKS